MNPFFCSQMDNPDFEEVLGILKGLIELKGYLWSFCPRGREAFTSFFMTPYINVDLFEN